MKKNVAAVQTVTFAGNDYLCHSKGHHLKGTYQKDTIKYHSFMWSVHLYMMLYIAEFDGVNCLDAALDSDCYQSKLSAFQMKFMASMMSNTTLNFALEYDQYNISNKS